MTRGDVIRMAREAGVYSGYESDLFQRFAALIAAHERDRAAKVCEHLARRYTDMRGAALEAAAENIRHTDEVI